MAACSSGSTADWSTSASWSGCRKPAFSSRVTLASRQQHPAVGRLGQRVDLDQRGVLGDERLPQLDRDVDDLVGDLGRELGGGRRSRGPSPRRRPCWRRSATLATLSGVSCGDLLDLHAAGDAGDAQEGAVGPVEQVGEVVLLGDVGGLGEHHLVDGVALDVHAEDVGRRGPRASSAPSASLTPPALPRPPTFTCALTTTRPPSRSAIARASSGVVGDAAGQHGQAVPLEQVAPLVLVQVHVYASRPLVVAGAVASRDRRLASIWPQPTSRREHRQPSGCAVCLHSHSAPAVGDASKRFVA